MVYTIRNARVAGLFYLLIFVGAAFQYGYIQKNLVVPGDAVATAAAIGAAGWLFPFSLYMGIIAFVGDVIVTAYFYFFLKDVQKEVSLAAAFFRLVQTAILGANTLNLVYVGHLVASPQTSESSALVMLFLRGHESGFNIAMIFFAFHCVLLGYLIYHSAHFSRWLGLLIAAAGATYFIDSSAQFLMPSVGAITNTVVSVVAIVAEFALLVWLLTARRAQK